MTLDQAKRRARANADYFGIPYYVFIPQSSGVNYYVERTKPANEASIVFTAQPSQWLTWVGRPIVTHADLVCDLSEYAGPKKS